MNKTNVISIACDAGEFMTMLRKDWRRRNLQLFPVGSRVVDGDEIGCGDYHPRGPSPISTFGTVVRSGWWGVLVVWDNFQPPETVYNEDLHLPYVSDADTSPTARHHAFVERVHALTGGPL